MILFHGSNMVISEPDVRHSRKNIDFGCGFYTTPIREQAQKWVEKFIRRGKDGIINIFEMDDNVLTQCRVLNFDTYSEEWLDFITTCRMGNDTTEYDLILGGVANDRVFNTCELYFKHYIDKKTALDRLRFEKPNLQICFKNQKTIERYLHYEGSERL